MNNIRMNENMKKAIVDLLMFLVVFIGLQIGVNILAGVVSPLFGVKADHPVVLVVSSVAANLATIVIFLWRHWGRVGKKFLSARPMATLGWAMAAAVGVVVPSVWLQELMPPLPDVSSEALLKMIHTTGGYFAIAIMAPVAEEVVFRGAILRRLLSVMHNKWGAICISAALFALVHGSPVQMPHAFLMGWLMGWLFMRTDSVVPGIVFHWMNNSIAYFLVLLMPNPEMKLIDLYGGNQTSLVLSIVFSLCIFIPSIVQLNQRMRK